MNKVLLGDNLEALSGLDEGCVDLIYADPPFGTGKDWGAFDDRWQNGLDGYLDWMRPRLAEMRRVLADTGSLWLHCDPTASHYLKVMLDDLFGRDNFRNEIVWERASGRSKGSQFERRSFGSDYDTLLLYSKSGRYVFNGQHYPVSAADLAEKFPLEDGRGRYNTGTPLFREPSGSPRPGLCYDYKGTANPHPSGWRVSRGRLAEMDERGEIVWRDGKPPLRKAYADDYKGKPVGNLWSDIPNVMGRERTGYPTQKPVALLERIIKTSSNEAGLVADPFCGSGTTLAAAKRLGRRWWGCDLNPQAVTLAESRLAAETPPLEGMTA